MRIQGLYEMSARAGKMSPLVYKAGKLLVNSLYPRLAKPQWGLDEESPVLISLTSFPARIHTLWITINTLLNQTVKPAGILLWLAEDQFPGGLEDLPKRLRDLQAYGLTIRFCENIYPHKKYYYTMRENPDKAVITVDDDMFYPENLVEELVALNRRFPDCVCCTWAHRITRRGSEVAPYREWEHCTMTGGEPSRSLLPVGCGGVLYPPRALCPDVFDIDKINKLCLRADDLWLKSMAALAGTKAVRWEKKTPIFFSIVDAQSSGLYHENLERDRNDAAMRAIMDVYPTLYELLNDDTEPEKK